MADVRPAKKARLLDDDSASDSDDKGGVSLTSGASFKVNKEYASRFEHNSKRSELHRLEAKYGAEKASRLMNGNGGVDEESSDSDDEEEDDDGILASGQLDDEVTATIKALRSKDPRVYDSTAKFYTVPIEAEDGTTTIVKTTKPMYLRDYQRETLLNGGVPAEDDTPLPTYAQEQAALKDAVVREMNEMDSGSESDDSVDDSDDGFLVKKEKQTLVQPEPDHVVTERDVRMANKNPEAFLDKFLDTRAWMTNEDSRFKPLLSDDEEDDQRMENFEEAYNLRFEDPAASNEKLTSHARDAAARYSVRQDGLNARQRAREIERAKKDALKAERQLEKAQLRKLKLQEAEKKLKIIQKAAGLKGKKVDVTEWAQFLTEDWDDSKWEEEMAKRFDEEYYAEEEEREDEAAEEGSKKRKPKKPEWDDDIDVNDLIPDFENEEQQFNLSEDETNIQPIQQLEEEEEVAPSKKSKHARKREAEAQKKASKAQRRDLEALVTSNMELDVPSSSKKNNRPPISFKYRATSPTSFGLTNQDILLASDKQLNQWAGIKKLASFREADKKRKDKKYHSKKARLKQWRRDTFGKGSEEGSKKSLQDVLRETEGGEGEIKKSKRRERAEEE